METRGAFGEPLLAQLDRASGFEPGGWGSKSVGAGHLLTSALGGKRTFLRPEPESRLPITQIRW